MFLIILKYCFQITKKYTGQERKSVDEKSWTEHTDY